MGKHAQHDYHPKARTRRGSLRMPNVRGKAVRHPSLAPAIAVDNSVIWPRDELAANVNRSRRQVANSKRTPWRRPKS